MSHILSIAFCFLSFSLFAQPNPKAYRAFENKTVAFEDNFDDDRNGWISGYFDSCYYREPGDTSTVEYFERAVMANGKLLMSEKSDIKKHFRPYQTNTTIDFNKDHEIELSLQIDGVKKHSNVAIAYWGRPCNSVNGYNIYITKKGGVVFFYSNKNIKKFVDKDNDKVYPSKAYNPDKFNKITIRKHSNKYYIFINEQFEAEIPFTTLEGDIFGLGKTNNNPGRFDYVKISYIK